jgi:hypothetical protein
VEFGENAGSDGSGGGGLKSESRFELESCVSDGKVFGFGGKEEWRTLERSEGRMGKLKMKMKGSGK